MVAATHHKQQPRKANKTDSLNRHLQGFRHPLSYA